MTDKEILIGKASEDYNQWLSETFGKDKSLNKWGLFTEFGYITEWLDGIGIHTGVFCGRYETFNWNIQVKGTYKCWTNDTSSETRKEAYEKLFEQVSELYNDGQLKQII